ncbi:hypothetical protein [Rhodococcoides fascians]|uniref:hypothetical protein n=1 Tax=Rhodococcoides fascians TaxID=1828 RepID=UPI0012D333CF|nr:hypothetical protein [Rhodococcus fascians]
MPDLGLIVKDHAKALLAARGVDCTASQNVPANWDRKSKPHVQVLDSAPAITKGWGRVSASSGNASIQLTVYAQDSTEAKRIANLLMALLFVGKLPRHIAQIGEGTGITSDRDPETTAQFAFFTVRVTATTVPV